MLRVTRRRFITDAAIATVAATSMLSACSRDHAASSARCAFCGMRIPPGSHWAAGATTSAGAAVSFDTPGCLFRYRFSNRGQGLRAPWITEYYGRSGAHVDARTVSFVPGSDVVGPMGPDLVPVATNRVDAFRRDHHGREGLAFDAVTADVIAHL